MNTRSANIFFFLIVLCTSFLSFSQDDDGLIILEDSDDTLIKFENHYFEALKYKAIGNYTRAITELEKCQQLFPDDKSVDFEFSKNYFLLNQFLPAELYIAKALKAEPENYWYLEQAKQIYLKQYNYQKAIEVQQKLVFQNPLVTEDLVLIYMQATESEKAQNLIDELESEGITSPKLRHYKETIAKKNNDRIFIDQKLRVVKNNNLEDLKKTFEENKQFDILKEILTQDLANENYENLLNYSEQGLELFPAQPFVYLMSARALMHQKKYNEAIDVLNLGIDFVIDDLTEADFYSSLASCYEATNQTEKAKINRKKAIQLRKKDTQ